jgi:hypothetical protein
VVEEFGILDALFPGRIDLGLGRSGGPRSPAAAEANGEPQERVVDGVLIPKPFSFAGLLGSPRFRAQIELLRQPEAKTPAYDRIVDDVLDLIAGRYRSSEGVEVHAVPGEGATVEPWVLGSSGADSAVVAGERGLRFAANYHVSPGTVLDAVEAYRGRGRRSGRRHRPAACRRLRGLDAQHPHRCRGHPVPRRGRCRGAPLDDRGPRSWWTTACARSSSARPRPSPTGWKPCVR